MMYYTMIRNDITKNKWVTLITVIFIVAAAMLLSLASMLTLHLSGSIDALMTKAKTPHFLQMHAGELNTDRLTEFAQSQPEVDDFQVLEFLQGDNTQIMMNGKTLANSVQDHGLVTQSQKFDYLLDLSGEVIHVSDGEMYVPINYMTDGSASVGDKVTFYEKEFKIAGFLRDSQMNSLLASSKRLLVSENDYAEMKASGRVQIPMQYLIEFRLKDLSSLGKFESDYIAAGLEANGPTITYSLFKMLNAISDGLMITMILLVSLLVVAIAMMCIRFTLLAKIEEEYREIGVMRALGLRYADIKKIYLVPYMAIASLGCGIGFALSFAFRGMLMQNITLYMGDSGNSSLSLFIGMVGVVILFLFIMMYVRLVLRRFRTISPTEALRYGNPQGKATVNRVVTLSRNKWFSTNVFLGIHDVFTRRKLYTTMLVVLILSTFMMVVPHHLYHTISSNNFISYMGIGKSDLRIDITQGQNASRRVVELDKALKQDPEVNKYAVFHTKVFPVKLHNGTQELIKIELGNHLLFPLNYAEGKAPAKENEISLSVLQAQELKVSVGDTLTLQVQGQDRAFNVSGIYSDITNGGKTAKAKFIDDSVQPIWSVIYASLQDQVLVSEKVKAYTAQFEFAKVTGIEEFKTGTFGSTIASARIASYVAVGIALMLTILVTLLFMKMLVMKDRYAIAVMKAIGFKRDDVMVQYLTRSIFVAVGAVIIGIFLANYIGTWIVGGILSSFGTSAFQFVIEPVSTYVIGPLFMMGAVLIATLLGASSINKIKIYDNMKE